MSTFIELGVGFNPDLAARDNVDAQRDHARPHPTRGARALRADHRLRRAARVRGPQAQELLVRHARAAGVLGDDPGGRRHPADRRGARRRRRRLPAEVLRRVRPAPRRGHARSCSSPTTWARSRASATARCCSSAGSIVGIGTPNEIARPVLRAQLRREQAAQRAERGGPPRRPAALDPRGLVRGRARRTREHARPGAAVRVCARVRFHRDGRRPDRSRSTFEDGEHRPLFATSSMWHEQRHRHVRRRRRGRAPRGLRQLVRAGPLLGDDARWRVAGAGDDALDRRERLASVVVARHAPDGGAVDLPHDLAIERSGSPELTDERCDGADTPCRRAAADPRPVGDRRRPAPLLSLTWTLAVTRVPAEVLRLGPRLLLAARAGR